jgi:hypothetical protein
MIIRKVTFLKGFIGIGEPGHVPLTNKIKLPNYQSILKAFKYQVNFHTHTTFISFPRKSNSYFFFKLILNQQESSVKSDTTTTPSQQQNPPNNNNNAFRLPLPRYPF